MVPRLNIAINFLKVNAHLSYTHIPKPCIKLPFRARQWLGQNLCKVQLQEWKLCVDMVCVRMYSMNTYRLPLCNSRGKWGPLWANTRSFYAGMSLCACERTSVCVCAVDWWWCRVFCLKSPQWKREPVWGEELTKTVRLNEKENHDST